MNGDIISAVMVLDHPNARTMNCRGGVMKLQNLQLSTAGHFDWSKSHRRPKNCMLVLNRKFSSFIIPTPDRGVLVYYIRTIYTAFHALSKEFLPQYILNKYSPDSI